jgi:short-subunit dehydrogenase
MDISVQRPMQGSCIIVGAGPMLGAALARRFAAAGARVGLIARNTDRLRELTTSLRCEGIAVDWRRADVADERQLRSAITALEGVCGPCDTLIYNAAVLRSESPLSLTAQQLRSELSVDVVGGLVAAQAVAAGMVDRGRGAIVFTGGGLAFEPYPEWASLAMGKAALRSLSLSLYKQLAPHNVHVAVVAICGIVAAGGPFDPAVIAEHYWHLATQPPSTDRRELVIQPAGTDPFYNDPDRRHRATTVTPPHARPRT